MANVLVVQSYRFSRAGVEETFVLPQLQLASEVQDYGFFWEMTSSMVFVFTTFGVDSGYLFCVMLLFVYSIQSSSSRRHRLQMKLHCPRHCQTLCSDHPGFRHQCYAFH